MAAFRHHGRLAHLPLARHEDVVDAPPLVAAREAAGSSWAGRSASAPAGRIRRRRSGSSGDIYLEFRSSVGCGTCQTGRKHVAEAAREQGVDGFVVGFGVEIAEHDPRQVRREPGYEGRGAAVARGRRPALEVAVRQAEAAGRF